MSIKEFLLSTAHYLARLLLERFTGTVDITLHMRNGGIGKINVHIRHDLQKNVEPIPDLEILNKL